MNTYYVYAWYNIETGFVFYVGEGTKRRVFETSSTRRNKKFLEYFKNNNCAVKLLESDIDKQTAQQKEQYWIEYYKQHEQATCNITPNGKAGCASGFENPNYGNGDALRKTYANRPDLKLQTSHYRGSNGRAKSIKLYSENGEYVKTFDCIADCAEFLVMNNIVSGSLKSISQRIGYYLKKKKTYNGFCFELN